MSTRRKMVVAGCALVVLCLMAYPVYAHCGKCLSSAKEMVKMMDSYKQTLSSAIASAETSTKGKALMAGVHDHEGVLTFNVWTLSGENIMLSTVEGSTGKVTTSEEVKNIGDHPVKEPAPKKV